MKLLANLLFMALFSPSAQAAAALDFNFNIHADQFRLELKQDFKKPLAEIRTKLTPTYFSQISNVVTGAEITPIKESITKVTVTGTKHGLSNVTASICTEKNTSTEWTKVCSLDLETGDTADLFNSGTENLHCTSTSGGTSCSLTLEANVKPQKHFFIYRSPEVLALGGIMERIHDQGVLSRVINLNETPAAAKVKFEDSSLGTCIDQIYSTYQLNAQRMAFTNKALEVQSSLWRCSL